jgi:hypothetical protein
VTAPVGAGAAYAAEVARLLWPEPWEEPYVTRTSGRAEVRHRDAYLFPGQGRPRLLVPTDLPGSATMLRRLGNGRNRLAGPVRRVLEHAVRSPAFAWSRWPVLRVPGPGEGADSVETHLSEVLGTDVRVGVMLGPRRVNQKPVLQVFDLAGRLRGYAKVGHNELTAGLVRHEAAALREIQRHSPRSFRAPLLLHHGQWAGLELVVMSPLAVARHRVGRRARLAATREVLGLTGHPNGGNDGPLAPGAVWQRLRADVDRLGSESDGARLASAAHGIEERHGADPVTLAAWHGDWGEWNMGMRSGVVQIWDWERFDPAVPAGFDGLHFAAQFVHPGQRDARHREEWLLRSVPEVLAGLGVPAERHTLTLSLYLLEIATRYVDGLVHGHAPDLRRRTTWVLSLLERLLAQRSVPSGGTR